jgi:hypothetical protein
VATEIDVLHPQTKALHQAQSRAVKQAGHEPFGVLQMRQHGFDFGASQDQGETSWAFGALDAFNLPQFLFEHLAIEEEQSAECLVLSRCGDVVMGGQMA